MAFFVTRIVLGLLWIQNSGWKTPPDFGRNAGSGLYKFTRFAVEHEVFAPYAFIVRELILPNFVVFGWLVLIVEASLGAFLLLGLATRLWALVGVAQSLAIALSVLNAPGEWSWAYYLMIAAHLAIFAAAAGRHWGLDSVLRPAWARSDSRLARLLLKAS
ncbi:MAG: DoxX family membrane protein [Actinobacteria bacterium]|nr:DoxX family membrane protein [Actinomycetota bacterium]